MASLVVVEGIAAGQRFALGQHALVMIGRDDDCTFQVLDERISRRHLQVRWDEQAGEHQAIDFESANGVYVNGKRMTERTVLHDGDTIKLGGTTIVYSRSDAEEALGRLDLLRRGGEHARSTIVRSGDDA